LRLGPVTEVQGEDFMKKLTILAAFAAVALVSAGKPSSAEILAMMNYESKTPDSLKALKLSGSAPRKEGIAIIDVDPDSRNFGKILMDVPLAPDLVAHHIFYDREQQKAYVTALGQSVLHVFDLNQFPYRLKRIAVPKCVMGEDVIFSEDNSTWYLTCMNSGNVYVGETATDKITGIIDIPGTNPHGLVVLSDIDRLLVTDTITGDLKTRVENMQRVATGNVTAGAWTLTFLLLALLFPQFSLAERGLILWREARDEVQVSRESDEDS